MIFEVKISWEPSFGTEFDYLNISDAFYTEMQNKLITQCCSRKNCDINVKVQRLVLEGFKRFQTIDISTLQMMRQYCQFRCHSRFLSIGDESLYINWLHKLLGCHVFGINVSRGCVKISVKVKKLAITKKSTVLVLSS